MKHIESTPEIEIQAKRKDNDIMLDVLSTVRMLDRRIRFMETNNEKQLIFEKELNLRENNSLSELRITVESLVEQELPDQVILDVLSDKGGYSRSIVRREIQRHREFLLSKNKKNNVS